MAFPCSFVTTTFVMEAMAAANAQLRWKRMENHQVCVLPLFPGSAPIQLCSKKVALWPVLSLPMEGSCPQRCPKTLVPELKPNSLMSLQNRCSLCSFNITGSILPPALSSLSRSEPLYPGAVLQLPSDIQVYLCLLMWQYGSIESFLIRYLLKRNKVNVLSIVPGGSVVTYSSFFPCLFLLLPVPPSPRRRKMTTPPRPPTVMFSSRTAMSGQRSGPSCLCVSLGIRAGPHFPLVHRALIPHGEGLGASLCRDPRALPACGWFLGRHHGPHGFGTWGPSLSPVTPPCTNFCGLGQSRNLSARCPLEA